MKYLERITQKNESKMTEKGLTFQNEEAKIKLQTDILKCESNINYANKELEQLKSAVDFNPEKIMTTNNTIELAKLKLKNLKALQKELF
jgi:hypothetical protein